MKRLIVSLLLLFCPLSHANTFGTDMSDLWFLPAESGWGVNVIHQGDILFITFFVYSPSNAPIWYSASAVQFVSNVGGVLTYSGKLYQTTAPWFGGPFPINSTTYREVGDVTFVANNINSATLTYKVDGVTVQKSVSRATWRLNNVAGSYLGAAIGTYSGCTNAAQNGYGEEFSAMTVTQTSTTASLQVQFLNAGYTCTYSGSYTQAGRMGSMSGNYSCSNGGSGAFLADEIEASFQALSARVSTAGNGCNWSGRFGGIRRGS